MAGRKKGQGSKWCRPATRLALYHRDGFTSGILMTGETVTLIVGWRISLLSS
jgi:hypothetical protein